MPIQESYQQAILDGLLANLFTSAGNSFTLVLYFNGTELSGNGYSRKSISTLPVASEVGENGLSTVRLVTDELLSASGGNITWDALELRDSTGTNLVFPRFSVSGTILSGESKKVTAVFGLPDNDATIARVSALETDVATLETDVDELTDNVDIPVTTEAELQAALTADITTKKSVKITGGRIITSNTINIVDGDGGRIYGENASLTSSIKDIENILVRLASVLQYDGTKTSDQAAIFYDRASCLFERFAFLGKDPDDILNDTGTNTPRGFVCERPGSGDPYEGIGSGKATFKDFLIGGFDVGWDWGNALADLNCDESQFDNIVAIGLGIMMRVNNLQGMGYKFKNLTIVSLVDKVFQMLAGGKLHAKNVFVGNPTTLLEMKKTLTDSFSHNNCTYTFENIDFDAQALQSQVLVCDPGNYFGDFHFKRGTFGTNEATPTLTNPHWHIGDQSHLVIEDWHNLMPRSISWTCTTNTSTITIKGCQAWTSLTDIEDIFRLDEAAGSVKVFIEGPKQYHNYDKLAHIENEVRTGAL